MGLAGLSGLSGLSGIVPRAVAPSGNWSSIPAIIPQYYSLLDAALSESGNASIVFEALVNSVGWLDASPGYFNTASNQWIALRGQNATGAPPTNQQANHIILSGNTWTWNVPGSAWGMAFGRRGGSEMTFSSFLSSRSVSSQSVPNTPGGESHANFSAFGGVSMDQINTTNERVNNIVATSSWDAIYPYSTNHDFILSNVFSTTSILYALIGGDAFETWARGSTSTRIYGFFFLGTVPSNDLRLALHNFFASYYSLSLA